MRVLVVLPESVTEDAVRQRCLPHVRQGHDLAVCYVAAAHTSLLDTLDVQRKVTSVLRQVLDGSAEQVPVFVVTQRAGDDIEECARNWGATEVTT
jgi:hypothetical protein